MACTLALYVGCARARITLYAAFCKDADASVHMQVLGQLPNRVGLVFKIMIGLYASLHTAIWAAFFAKNIFVGPDYLSGIIVLATLSLLLMPIYIIHQYPLETQNARALRLCRNQRLYHVLVSACITFDLSLAMGSIVRCVFALQRVEPLLHTQLLQARCSMAALRHWQMHMLHGIKSSREKHVAIQCADGCVLAKEAVWLCCSLRSCVASCH